MDSPKIDNEVYRMTVEPSRTSDEWRIVTYFKKIHTPVRFYVNDHFVFTISKCMAKILRSQHWIVTDGMANIEQRNSTVSFTRRPGSQTSYSFQMFFPSQTLLINGWDECVRWIKETGPPSELLKRFEQWMETNDAQEQENELAPAKAELAPAKAEAMPCESLLNVPTPKDERSQYSSDLCEVRIVDCTQIDRSLDMLRLHSPRFTKSYAESYENVFGLCHMAEPWWIE